MKAPARLRVLMTTDTVGGVWTYAATLASALARLDIDVLLVTIGPPTRPDQRTMIAHPHIQLIDSGLDLEWQDPAGDDEPRARAVLGNIDACICPDIVHLNGFREARYDWSAPTLVVAHSCVNSWAHTCDDTGWLQQPEWRRYTEAVSQGLDRARLWVAPTLAFRDEVVRIYRPVGSGVVIHNGVAPVRQPQSGKQQFILAAGRMRDAAKNLAAVSEAAEGLPWPVCVAGEADASPDRPTAHNLVRLGVLPHAGLTTRMQRAGIFVSPALYEPFGLAVLEAAAAGCALVLSDIPSFRELWDGAARFVAPNDTAALHHVLGELCRDRPQRLALQDAARMRAQNYALAGTAAAYADLYRAHAAPRAHATDAIKVPA
jgi:glycosyltransferase involved in cell wall biosynthesis